MKEIEGENIKKECNLSKILKEKEKKEGENKRKIKKNE